MPLSRQQVYRRRRVTIFTGIVVVLSAGFYLPMTLLAPLPPVAADTVSYSAPAGTAAAPAVPSYGASGIAAVGMPGLLASSGTGEALPIASISKVITTLVVLDAKPLAAGSDGATIAFTSADVQIYNDYLADNGSVKPVYSGLELTQREVIDLTLVASANNYAQSLVNWAFGSEKDYVEAATAWLAANGMTSTTVEDSTGMSPDNTSTPADLVLLGQLAVADPIVSQIVATQSVTVPDVGALSNTNKLLGIDGIDGIKTGTLDEAGACLLFSADVLVGDETITLVGVILGGPNHDTLDDGVRSLLSSVVSGFQQVQLTAAGQQFGTYNTQWGGSTDLVTTEAASTVLWSDTPITTTVDAASIAADPAGQDVGSVTFSIGSEQISVPLELDSEISDPGPWWRLTHPGSLF